MKYISNTDTSTALFQRAQQHIPGGVNSPVRAFRAVGGNPLFIKKAHGAYITDEDDNAYLELINSWGPMILGHNHPMISKAVSQAIQSSLSFGAPTRREIEIAELVCAVVPSIEKVRFVNSGTEACMSAIRAARGYTERSKIIKFEGCYHGHGDSFLIAAGSGAMTMGAPDSAGVTEGTAKDTLTAQYNNFEQVSRLIDANEGQIAAIILEPVAGNMGLVIPQPEFLRNLREICTRKNIVLIFDEVMTGFRLALGGAQELYGVVPDMTTLGKIIGGGLPVGAYGGKADIMNCVSPVGKVYQAGTLSGNPIAVAAGYVLLRHLADTPNVYTTLLQRTTEIVQAIQRGNQAAQKSLTVNQVGSMFTLFFTDQSVQNLDDAKQSDTAAFGRYFQAMLRRGVYLAPSQFESMFVSTAWTRDDVAYFGEAHAESIKEVFAI